MKIISILTSVLIIVAVLIPGRDVPDVNIIGIDKMAHTVLFALWALAVQFDFSPRPQKLPLIFLMGLTFGITTEILQIYTEDRSFDWLDIAADAAGLCIGLVVGRWTIPLLSRFRKPRKL